MQNCFISSKNSKLLYWRVWASIYSSFNIKVDFLLTLYFIYFTHYILPCPHSFSLIYYYSTIPWAADYLLQIYAFPSGFLQEECHSWSLWDQINEKKVPVINITIFPQIYLFDRRWWSIVYFFSWGPFIVATSLLVKLNKWCLSKWIVHWRCCKCNFGKVQLEF